MPPLDALPPPLQRRRDALLSVLSEQYGGDALAYFGPPPEAGQGGQGMRDAFPELRWVRAPPAAAPSQLQLPAFAVAVAVDAAVGAVLYAPEGAGCAVLLLAAPAAGADDDAPPSATAAVALETLLWPAVTVGAAPSRPAAALADDPKLLGTLRRTVATVDALFAAVNVGAGRLV